MVVIGVVLWKYIMCYNFLNLEWFDWDRFVLLNGMLFDFRLFNYLFDRERLCVDVFVCIKLFCWLFNLDFGGV